MNKYIIAITPISMHTYIFYVSTRMMVRRNWWSALAFGFVSIPLDVYARWSRSPRTTTRQIAERTQPEPMSPF